MIFRFCIATVLCLLAIGCRTNSSPPQNERAIRAYVGPNMKASIIELGRRFEARTGICVEVRSDEVRKLMQAIDAGEAPDLFITHDPFLSLALARGWKVDRAWQVASLKPVIVVAKGNPKGIRKLEDLARPMLRVGLTDTASTISGEIVSGMLDRAGVKSQVLANVVKRTSQGRDLAAAMVAGEVEAGIVWNAVAHSERNRLDRVDIDPKWSPVRGVNDIVINAELGRLELDYVRVTIALLDHSTRKVDSASFAALCATDEGAAVFESNGFSPPDRQRPAIPVGSQ